MSVGVCCVYVWHVHRLGDYKKGAGDYKKGWTTIRRGWATYKKGGWEMEG